MENQFYYKFRSLKTIKQYKDWRSRMCQHYANIYNISSKNFSNDNDLCEFIKFEPKIKHKRTIYYKIEFSEFSRTINNISVYRFGEQNALWKYKLAHTLAQQYCNFVSVPNFLLQDNSIVFNNEFFFFESKTKMLKQMVPLIAQFVLTDSKTWSQTESKAIISNLLRSNISVEDNYNSNLKVLLENKIYSFLGKFDTEMAPEQIKYLLEEEFDLKRTYKIFKFL